MYFMHPVYILHTWDYTKSILPWKEIISFRFLANSEKLEEASRKLINENKLKAGKSVTVIDVIAFSNVLYFLTG